MTTARENEVLTRVGPGTPCGKLMRCYWQPAALAEALGLPVVSTVGIRRGGAASLVQWLEAHFASQQGGRQWLPPPLDAEGDLATTAADQREVELLVEAGLTPLEAIKVCTLNGATYLGIADRAGTIGAGKQADLVLIERMRATMADALAPILSFMSEPAARVADAIETGRELIRLREENALFSGDHVMGWSTSVIAPPDGDMAAYMASLDKLAARGVGHLFYFQVDNPLASRARRYVICIRKPVFPRRGPPPPASRAARPPRTAPRRRSIPPGPPP